VLASVNMRGPPMTTLWPSTTAFAPRPGRASKFVAPNRSAFRRLASATIALASGCSEVDSTAAARAIKSSSVLPGAATTSEIAGEPRVRVPVLSKMTMSRLRARSSASRSLTRSPFWAPSDVEIAITSGIASPRACGQAMMRTVAVRIRACSLSPENHQ